MLGDCEGPEFHAVVELPRIYILDAVLGQVISYVSHVQAQLPDVQEAKLIGSWEVNTQQLHEAVLSDTNAVLNLEAASSGLGLLGEVSVHLLDCEFE
jgi:hypothetical protein